MKKPESIGYYNLTILIFGLCFVLFGIAHEKIFKIFRKIDGLFETKTYQVLITILVISLLIRFLFLPERWINPDEGAHLYDAKFILDGKIPFVDYGSRMPVYVYILAAFLKVFGVSYLSGRLLAIFSNIGIGILVFLIGKKLFKSNKIALLSSAIYLFSPLSILWSVVVKTELPETLFVSLGMFLLLSYIRYEEKYYLIFFSGFFSALAFYIRESALMVLIGSIIFVTYFHKKDIYKVIKTNSIMLLGYFSVVFFIFLYFSSFMGFAATWDSPLNPLNIVESPVKKVIGFLNEDSIALKTSDTGFRLNDQPYNATIANWFMTLLLNFYLVVGLIISIVIFLYHFTRKTYDHAFSEFGLPYIFLYSWFFIIFIFYVYYTIQRGFYNQYFGEMLPPLAIITSHVVYRIASNQLLQKNLRIFILIIFFTTFLSSIYFISPSFNNIWSPETVEEVSQYLIMNSDIDTEVMSGAVIWSFESNTKPFMNITHPLAFRPGMSKEQIEKVEDRLSNSPPLFIILDGYTEQTYIRHVSNIKNILNESYSLEKEVVGSMYTVKVYRLKR